MRTHLITYHNKNNRILGERILYDLTNEQALELFNRIKSWAHAMFPNCEFVRLENLQSGDVICSYGVNL